MKDFLCVHASIKAIKTHRIIMMRTPFKLLFLVTPLLLAACAPQSEVRQMHRSVSTLNKEMGKLQQETVKITQQNALNARSQSGAYLLPGANTPARLNSQLGMMKISLANVAADASGTLATLRIQGESSTPFPAFTGTIEWGQLQGTTENYQEVNVQNQQFSAPASILAPSDVSIPVKLNGITPDQLGFVRVHDIQPLQADPAPAMP